MSSQSKNSHLRTTNEDMKGTGSTTLLEKQRPQTIQNSKFKCMFLEYRGQQMLKSWIAAFPDSTKAVMSMHNPVKTIGPSAGWGNSMLCKKTFMTRGQVVKCPHHNAQGLEDQCTRRGPVGLSVTTGEARPKAEPHKEKKVVCITIIKKKIRPSNIINVF